MTTLGTHEWKTHSHRHQTTLADEETTVTPEALSYPHCKAWLIRERTCSLPGHVVCLSTADGEHYHLSDKDIEVWATALCREDTTTQPPQYVLTCRRNFSIYLNCLEEGKLHPEAILGALLRYRHETSLTTKYDPPGGNDSSFTDNAYKPSSWLQHRRYQPVKAITWTMRLLIMQDSYIVIRKRMWHHLLRLRDWQEMRHPEVGKDMEMKLFEILRDALEISRACYSRRANEDAAFIGLEIQRWILSCPGAVITQATAPWLCRVYISLAPLFLAGIHLSKSVTLCDNPFVARQMLEELLNTVTDKLLGFQVLKTASSAIKLIARCLHGVPYVHPYTPLLGENLVRIIDTVMHMRVLNEEEVNAICLMAADRLDRADRNTLRCRPWEVVLCAQCEPQEPLLREVVLGKAGLPSLLHAFKVLPRPWSRKSKDKRHMVDILTALQQLSKHLWFSDAVEPGLMDLWTNLRRGGILEHLSIDRIEILSTSQTDAYSPITGRRTIAHKTGMPSLEGPSTISDPTPLEEHYKQMAADCTKQLCMEMKRWVAVTESVPPSLSLPGLPTPLDSNPFLSSPTTNTPSVNWSYSSTTRSDISSAMPGIGYLSAKVLEWIGEGTLDTIAQAVIWKRTNHHLSRLRRWQKQHCEEIDHSTLRKMLAMVRDSLEMSDSCYSPRVNHYATSIGKELQQWLIASVDTSVMAQNASLIVRMHICICAALLATDSESTSLLELLDTIQRVPLEFDDSAVTSSAIRIISKEVSRPSYSACRNLLEMSLMQIVQATLQSRPFTGRELDAIHEILDSRLRLVDYDVENCHPWEVAIFAECASQDPTFTEAIFGDHGIPSIIHILQEILSNQSLSTVEWDHVCCLVSVLHQLSRHTWIASAVEPAVIGLLLNVFIRTGEGPQFRLRYLAIQAIQNIVSCPGKCRSCVTDIMETSLSHGDPYPPAPDNVNGSSTSLHSSYSIRYQEAIGEAQAIRPGTHATPALHLQSRESIMQDRAPVASLESDGITGSPDRLLPSSTRRTWEDGDNAISSVVSAYQGGDNRCHRPAMLGGWI